MWYLESQLMPLQAIFMSQITTNSNKRATRSSLPPSISTWKSNNRTTSIPRIFSHLWAPEAPAIHTLEHNHTVLTSSLRINNTKEFLLSIKVSAMLRGDLAAYRFSFVQGGEKNITQIKTQPIDSYQHAECSII